MNLLMRMLQGRLQNCHFVMEKSNESIKVSDKVYENVVDYALTVQSQHLNQVMKALTVITVMIIPFNIVSGFFGMNV